MKTAQETKVEMATDENPTLNEFFRRNPKTLSEEDLLAKIEAERTARANYLAKRK